MVVMREHRSRGREVLGERPVRSVPLSPCTHIRRQQALRPQGRLVRVHAHEDQRRKAFNAQL